jgi:hypothetical protein
MATPVKAVEQRLDGARIAAKAADGLDLAIAQLRDPAQRARHVLLSRASTVNSCTTPAPRDRAGHGAARSMNRRRLRPSIPEQFCDPCSLSQRRPGLRVRRK